MWIFSLFLSSMPSNPNAPNANTSGVTPETIQNRSCESVESGWVDLRLLLEVVQPLVCCVGVPRE
jgi:hypothetical protein